MKFFLAYSFSALIDDKTGLVDDKNKQFLENMRNSIIKRKETVFWLILEKIGVKNLWLLTNAHLTILRK